MFRILEVSELLSVEFWNSLFGMFEMYLFFKSLPGIALALDMSEYGWYVVVYTGKLDYFCAKETKFFVNRRNKHATGERGGRMHKFM